MALFGGAIALSALALSVTLTKSSVGPVEDQLARIFSDPETRAAIPPLPQSKPDDIITGSIAPNHAGAYAGPADRLTTTGQEVLPEPDRPFALSSEETLALAMARRQQEEDEAAAKVALVAELAKGLLRRRLLAARETEGGADSTADGSITVAALEPETEETDTGEITIETDVANAETAPDMTPETAPVPSKRPEVPSWARAKDDDKEKSKGRKTYPQLAYAAPEDPTTTDDSGGGGLFGGLSKVFSGGGGKGGLPGRGSGIAVYDIKSATVYMPDGQKLEAHSGLGHMKDNPNYTKRKNRGPTPPNVYKLVMRESLYHGVEAVRMLPTDRGAMHGRDGMLAHTSLVRGTNGSHGCVAFKNYSRFLAAFKAGKVKKMIVVPDLRELPVYMASL
ncbi:DUF2778 domain-containing protein [Roseibium aggregatum]|uniref:DUF2778 domain-containing protein n=1 Tax=Roseibium aggregatum TaxID=187304 RepID=A0A926S7V5_9HYPH|nr:DUF2778 domain-containing protein [Roseibium aggregatum]MBD1548725.1 DUF2778 domain-containing protein [Roseibium aggregatum]